ncbi:MAG TPA: CHAD domain-containing protein, partial [Candidatus Acidoferrales bacterium]|nr:CHAD domain-containing protein [Candidatus Acidoferrales bacterium]
MAQTITLPTPGNGKKLGFEVWMSRVLENADKAGRDWDADDVHDLRVALRRCRTMAEALDEVNPC